MTLEDLEKYKKMDELFGKECERVAKCLEKSNYSKYEDIWCANKFTMDCGSVVWEGWVGGCSEGGRCGVFDLDFLLMSDEELKEMVAKGNKEIEEAKKLRRLEQEKRELEAKKAKYEQLRKELGYDN